MEHEPPPRTPGTELTNDSGPWALILRELGSYRPDLRRCKPEGMHPKFLHERAAELSNHPAGTGLTGSAPATSGTTDPITTLASADRACCCLAKPVVMAVLPPTAGRPHAVDLLLCGHHYHVSKDALASANATVCDSRGLPIEVGQEALHPVGAR